MISVVIRTFNEAENLKRLLKILSLQNIKNEIIIVDSDSIDDTINVAKDYNAKIIQCIPFTYGRGLNIGIREAQYDYICCLSSHCFPLNDNFLLTLKSNFTDKIAGVYARQLPLEESNILDKRNLSMVFRNERLIQTNDSFFNNAASMFRKSLWEEIPFNEKVDAFEDVIWSHGIQKKGYLIVYEPNAMCYHYHNESIEYTLKRYAKEYRILKNI